MISDLTAYSSAQRILTYATSYHRYYSSFFNKKPYLRYIWVGPPPDNSMDIKCVLEMANHTDNPIEYYCLNEHMYYYVSVFRESKVNIKSIEASLDKLVVNAMLKRRIKTIFKIALERDTITDRVSIKELVSLILLSHCSGYTLDTNISLDTAVSCSAQYTFPDHPHFMAPYTTTMPCPEVWMMYSSALDLSTAYKALSYYLDNWFRIQKYYPDLLSYNHQIVGLTVDAVHKLYFDPITSKPTSLGMQERNWLFRLEDHGNAVTARIHGLPIIKTYHNSHRIDLGEQRVNQNA